MKWKLLAVAGPVGVPKKDRRNTLLAHVGEMASRRHHLSSKRVNECLT